MVNRAKFCYGILTTKVYDQFLFSSRIYTTNKTHVKTKYSNIIQHTVIFYTSLKNELLCLLNRCVANAPMIKALSNENSSSSTIVRPAQPPKDLMTKIANLPTTVDTVCIYNTTINLQYIK